MKHNSKALLILTLLTILLLIGCTAPTTDSGAEEPAAGDTANSNTNDSEEPGAGNAIDSSNNDGTPADNGDSSGDNTVKDNAGDEAAGDAGQSTEPEQGTTSLSKSAAGQLWQLINLTSNGNEIAVPADFAPTIQFAPDGTLGGYGGCNNYFGSFTESADHTISFGPLGATEMFCQDTMVLETAYLAALGQVTHFSLRDKRLQLYSADEQQYLIFALPDTVEEPPVEQTLIGSEWLLQSFIDGEVATFLADSGITLTFDDAGNIGGFGGCNSFSGTYERGQEGHLTITVLVTTMAFCEKTMEQETQFLAMLDQVQGFRIDRDGLHLYSADETIVLDFVTR